MRICRRNRSDERDLSFVFGKVEVAEAGTRDARAVEVRGGEEVGLREDVGQVDAATVLDRVDAAEDDRDAFAGRILDRAEKGVVVFVAVADVPALGEVSWREQFDVEADDVCLGFRIGGVPDDAGEERAVGGLVPEEGRPVRVIVDIDEAHVIRLKGVGRWRVRA